MTDEERTLQERIKQWPGDRVFLSREEIGRLARSKDPRGELEKLIEQDIRRKERDRERHRGTA